jgi:MFS family permease
LISVPANIVQWLTARPWGRFIEKYGIRLTLVIGSIGLAINPMLAVLAAYLPDGWKLPGMMVLNLVTGVTFSAFMLSILQCMLEVVPERYRTINISVYTTLLLIMNTLGPLVGVRIFILLGSDLKAMTLSMLVSSIIRFIGGGLFLLRWHLLRSCHS